MRATATATDVGKALVRRFLHSFMSEELHLVCSTEHSDDGDRSFQRMTTTWSKR